jgi:hypothetical protein
LNGSELLGGSRVDRDFHIHEWRQSEHYHGAREKVDETEVTRNTPVEKG